MAEINARLAALSSCYNQNLIQESGAQAVYIEDEAGLEGLPIALRNAAATAASEKGRPGIWAVPNARGAVWPFLTLATRRDLREKVWRMWTNRGDNAGPHDNKPIANEILQLRGELARLLGFASYAHFAMADRMAGKPDTALDLLERTWQSVKSRALAQIADHQAVADREGHGIGLAPWDRQFYAEKLRRERFNLDSDEVKAHMTARDLPRHPLVARGYPSIGCSPCTTQAGFGEDARAGRWRNREKIECGIHFTATGPVRETAA